MLGDLTEKVALQRPFDEEQCLLTVGTVWTNAASVCVVGV